jgi:hypothetical protein
VVQSHCSLSGEPPRSSVDTRRDRDLGLHVTHFVEADGDDPP